MKMAIASQGKELLSEVDLRFGRGEFLLAVDSETDDFEVHDIELNLNAVERAGIQTWQNTANLSLFSENRIMKTFLDCIPCFVRQALDSARLVTNDEKIHDQVVRETLRLAADLEQTSLGN